MKDINILIFGDSIVYGAWDVENAGWVNRLRLVLENKNDCYYNIFNLGIPGDTTENVKKRFVYECNHRYNINAQTVIIFSVGINDSYMVTGKNNVSILDFKNNILDLINMAKKYTKNILFIGLSKVNESLVNPLIWDDNISYLNEEILKYDKELESICCQNKIAYLNIFDLLEISDLKDGLHPNSVGHQKMCDEILRELEK